MSMQELNLKAIADAIRAKDGTTDPIPANTFAERIASLPSGGGDTSVEDSLITRTISGAYSNGRVTSVGDYAFYNCVNLTSVSLPLVTTLSKSSVFYGCTGLVDVDLPLVTRLGMNVFQRCSGLVSIDLPSVIAFSAGAFYDCSSLERLILRANSVCTLMNYSSTFSGTPIAAGTGYIYVPDDLVDDYKASTNWSAVADQIKPLSELEE